MRRDFQSLHSRLAIVFFSAFSFYFLFCAQPSVADACPKIDDRTPLCRNDYRIDIYQGPVYAPIRVTGLAGAYAALADGVDGLGQNAAATGVRAPFSMDWFDQDVSLGFSLPGAFGSSDFDNRGSGTLAANASNFFATAGGQLQFGALGIGGIVDIQRYGLKVSGDEAVPAEVFVLRSHSTAAWAFWRQQLIVGAGVRVVAVLVNASGRDDANNFIQRNVLTMSGVAPEMGFLYKPDFKPYRIGLTYRFPVETSNDPNAKPIVDSSGVSRVGGLAMPSAVRWPWEVEAGVALSAGPRPLNPTWIDQNEHEAADLAELEKNRAARARAVVFELDSIEDPTQRAWREHELQLIEKAIRAEEERNMAATRIRLREERRARYNNWPREYILVTLDVLVTGKTSNAIGLQSFLRQEDIQSGGRVTVQPRLGLEGEPVPYRLAARVGTYLEPTRYNVPPSGALVAGSRQHFTAGLDIKLFPWNILGFFPYPWRISFAADVAPRFQSYSAGIGVWH